MLDSRETISKNFRLKYQDPIYFDFENLHEKLRFFPQKFSWSSKTDIYETISFMHLYYPDTLVCFINLTYNYCFKFNIQLLFKNVELEFLSLKFI